ncbi:hypothetical protein [Streptomyces sp. NPDC023838]|uniref:hypothetical protein n=1 Tax=Streptomyces sp. NPDC023838 TaxID=3154325 RepID=UPI0033D63E77
MQLEGNFTAVDVTVPAGESRGAVTAALRKKYDIPATGKDGKPVRLLDALGQQNKIVVLHEKFNDRFAFFAGDDKKDHANVITYLPWSLAKRVSAKRVTVVRDYSTVRPGGGSGTKDTNEPFVPALVDELSGRCQGLQTAVCKVLSTKGADVLARSEQLVGLAQDAAEYKNLPKPTAPLNETQAAKNLKASQHAVNANAGRVAPAGKTPSKVPDLVPTKLTGWAVAFSATAFRAQDTFRNDQASTLDKIESLVAAVPLLGETVGFGNALAARSASR